MNIPKLRTVRFLPRVTQHQSDRAKGWVRLLVKTIPPTLHLTLSVHWWQLAIRGNVLQETVNYTVITLSEDRKDKVMVKPCPFLMWERKKKIQLMKCQSRPPVFKLWARFSPSLVHCGCWPSLGTRLLPIIFFFAAEKLEETCLPPRAVGLSFNCACSH